MGCPTALRRTPFSSAARKSLPDSITKGFSSDPVSCARTGMPVKPKTEWESKIHTSLRFMLDTSRFFMDIFVVLLEFGCSHAHANFFSRSEEHTSELQSQSNL